MNDIDVMRRAKQYIESLANGIDPLSGNDLPENDIVNNVRISRCLFYTADVLQKVIDNGGEVQREKLKRSERADLALTDEQISALRTESGELSASKIAGIINAQIDELTMKKLKGTTITHLMIDLGLIEETEDAAGRAAKLPTEAGEELGIVEKVFEDYGKKVWYSAYTEKAQQFIFDNIDALCALAAEEEAEKASKKRKDTAYDDGE